MLRVLLVDDNPIFLEAVRLALDATGEVSVVGECRGGAEAIHFTGQNDVDIALVDLKMPEIDGIETARQLRALRPGLYIVIVSLCSSGVPEEVFARGDVQRFIPKRYLFEAIPSLLRACRERSERLQ